MLVLLAAWIHTETYSQYVVEYPYLYFQDSYGTPVIGSGYFALPRPTDTYKSMRLRSISSGFDGLIRDEYTDLFRNPATGLPATSSGEVFGDFGSMNDLGRFTFGGFFKTERNTLGASTTLDRLQKRTTTFESQNTSGTPLSISNSNSISETNPEGIGLRISSSFTVTEEHSIGLSYEYFNNKDDSRFQYSSSSLSPGSSYSNGSTQDISTNGDIHKIGMGGILKTERGELQLIARGVFSKYVLDNLYSTSSRSTYNRSNRTESYPSSIKTNGYLLGAMYECSRTEGQILRGLFEFALTRYTTSGMSSFDVIDSSSYTYWTTSSGTRSSDGTITDIRCGIGYERNVVGGVTGYAGLSVAYIRNSYNASQSSVSRQILPPPPPSYPPIASSANDESVLDGFLVRLPLGAEALIGDYVILRGGIEPSYQTGQTSSEYRGTNINIQPTTYASKNKVDQRGLAFSSQFGIAAHHDDYGEISILLGRNIADTNYWSFFVRYFL